MRAFIALLLLVWLAAPIAIARPAARTLVVLETVESKANYSKFLGSLEGMNISAFVLLGGTLIGLLNCSPIDRGHHLTYTSSKKEDFGLVVYEELAYDNLLLFSPSVACE